MVTLIATQANGKVETKRFDSRNLAREYLKWKYDKQACRAVDHKPRPMMISGDDHKVTWFTGYDYR